MTYSSDVPAGLIGCSCVETRRAWIPSKNMITTECVDDALNIVPEIPGEVIAAAPEEECPQGATSPESCVAGVCVDVVDLGVVETPWGAKPKIKFVFELAQEKPNGYRVTASRTYTKSSHEKSALRPELERWLGRPLNERELTGGFPYRTLAGRACTLTMLPALSESGHAYQKILSIGVATEPVLKPSGAYRRWEN